MSGRYTLSLLDMKKHFDVAGETASSSGSGGGSSSSSGGKGRGKNKEKSKDDVSREMLAVRNLCQQMATYEKESKTFVLKPEWVAKIK